MLRRPQVLFFFMFQRMGASVAMSQRSHRGRLVVFVNLYQPCDDNIKDNLERDRITVSKQKKANIPEDRKYLAVITRRSSMLLFLRRSLYENKRCDKNSLFNQLSHMRE